MNLCAINLGGGSGSAGDAFTTIQPDAGTAPVATSATDTLTLTSSVILVTGNSGTDTISYSYMPEVDHGNMGATETIDFSNGPSHYGNVSAECTITLSNPVDGGAYVILIEANGTHEVLWPTITWNTDGGTAPDISALADGSLCIVSLYYSGTKAAYVGTYAVAT